MTELFNPSNWLQERLALNIQTVDIEGMEFEIMALDDTMIEDLKAQESYDECLHFAADFGLSLNRQRVIETDGIKDDLELLWSKVHASLQIDPCVKFRLGEKVCEISGLTDYIVGLLPEEEMVIDGDEITADDLNRSLGDFTNQQKAIA